MTTDGIFVSIYTAVIDIRKRRLAAVFSKLKKQSVMILTFTVISLIFFQIIINYFSYKKILYKDFKSKATIFSELYAENINTYLKQFDRSLSIFLSGCNPDDFDKSIPLKENIFVSELLTNMAKYKFDANIQDIIIISDSGEYISYNNFFDFDALMKLHVTDILQKKDTALYYNPDASYYTAQRAAEYSNKHQFLYGKTFKDKNGAPLFYVMLSLNTNVFESIVNIDKYFTKGTSVYLVFDKYVFTVNESKETKLNAAAINPKGAARKNCIRTEAYNKTYDITVISNTLSNDSSFFINMIIPLMIGFAVIVGIICFLCAQVIVGQIIDPLEKISIKMKHFK